MLKKKSKSPSTRELILKMSHDLDFVKQDLASFRQEFNAYRTETNNRFDMIDSRLDYIVKANNLKDLPNKN